MPTLLQINVSANWGSTGKIAEQIGLLAQKSGWNSYIAYGRYMNSSSNKLIKIGSMLDVYEHYVENVFLDNEGRASRRATKKFLKIVDKIKPDLVHLHNIHDHYLNYELLFRYLAVKKIPVVWTQHDLWAITGHCFYFGDCNRWKEECYDCEVSNWFSLDFSKRNHRYKKNIIAALPYLKIVTVSDWLAGIIRQSHLKDRFIEVVHNGIDLNVFRPQKKNFFSNEGIVKGKKILLGVASVWNKRKGLEDLFKLAESLPIEEYILIIVGKVSEKKYILKDCQGNSCQIIFIDRTQNQKELAMLYSMADILLSLSYGETFGMTMVEAYACGTPCIVYDNTAQPELITPDTGRVARTGDIGDVLRCIYEMINGDFKSIHAKDCRQRAEQMYDKNKCFEKYLILYESFVP